MLLDQTAYYVSGKERASYIIPRSRRGGGEKGDGGEGEGEGLAERVQGWGGGRHQHLACIT